MPELLHQLLRHKEPNDAAVGRQRQSQEPLDELPNRPHETLLEPVEREADPLNEADLPL